MFVQKGWRRISAFRLIILAPPFIHREASPHWVRVREFNAHIATITERSVIDYKKKLLGIFAFLLSYCNCFLPLFCLIVLKFLCTNFSVLPIRFSKCSVHFPCTEVTNPQTHTLPLPPSGGCSSSPCGLCCPFHWPYSTLQLLSGCSSLLFQSVRHSSF